VAAYQQALDLDPSLEIEPEPAAKQIAALALIEQAKNLAQNGETAAAIAPVAEAQTMAQALNSVALHFSICRLQTFKELTEVVAASCQALAAQAPTIKPGSPVSGSIDGPAGDLWKLEIAAGSLVTMTLSATDNSSLDPYLILYAAKFQIIGEHDDIEAGVIQDSALNAVALTEPGLYWVLASRCCPDNDQESAGAYELEVTVKQEEE